MLTHLLLTLSLAQPDLAGSQRVAEAASRDAARPKAPAVQAAEADPYQLVQQANALVEQREYQRALEIVDGLLKRYPQSQSSHLLRALALDGLGRLEEAKKSYEAALGVAPKDPQILSLLGKHYLRRELWEDAIRCFEQSLAAAPDDVDTLFYLAQARFQTLNKGKALEAIERCAVLAPSNPTIQLKLGEYRAQARKMSPALEALQKAQALNPDEPGLDLALGVVQLSLLDVNAARSAFERALKREPDNITIISGLAEACTEARDYATAKRLYQTLLDRGQLEAPYYLGLGRAFVGLGEHQAAIAPLTRAIELNPKLSEVHFHLARAYRGVGRLDDAQRELRIFPALKENPFGAFEDRPELEQTVWRQVEALAKAGKESEALQLIAAGNTKEDAPPPGLALGALYYTLGRYRDAERLLTEAIRTSPTLLKARAYLGLAYLQEQRLADAERVLTEEMQRNPKDPLALMAFGKLQFRKQSWSEAVRILRESRVIEPDVQLMLCEAQLQLGQRAQAQETAQLIAVLSAGDARLRPALDRLLARFSVKLEGDAASAPSSEK